MEKLINLEVLYKELSGNDSFETPEDRKSIYLDKLEKQYPGILCSLAQCMVVKTTDLDYEDEGFYTTEPIDINPNWWTVMTKFPNGAICLFYNGAMERLSMIIGGSYYVACSIENRVVIIAQEYMSLDRFKRLTQRKYNDVGYFYNAESGKFALV